MKKKIQRPAEAKIKYQPNQWLLAYSAMGLMFFIEGLIFLLEFLKKGIIRYQFLLPAEVTDPQRENKGVKSLTLTKGKGYAIKHTWQDR
jgi:hypothetical protein